MKYRFVLRSGVEIVVEAGPGINSVVNYVEAMQKIGDGQGLTIFDGSDGKPILVINMDEIASVGEVIDDVPVSCQGLCT